MRKLLCLSLFLALGQSIRAERPNIVFLFSDDQSTYSVGCYGNEDVQTPNMDQLGADGIIFDRHYNTTAICMASRANVVTGMYEYKIGCNFGKGNLTEDKWKLSYPVLLRQNGYLTGFAGKVGFRVGKKEPDETQFDMYGGSPGQTSYETRKNKSMAAYADRYPHSTLSYGAFGQDFIKWAVKEDKPFCLSISFKAPHRPVTPDPKFDHIYDGKTFTKPANFGRKYGTHLSEQSKQGRQYARFTDWNYDTDYDQVMAKYHQLVYAVDVAVGMIREELVRQGVADNTVIIFSSDNGFICGSHGYASKVLPMEESSRVPLIIYDPRSNTSGKQLRSDALTGNIDFAPTILELAGLPVPENMDGLSLLPLIENPHSDIREHMAFINTWGPVATTCLTALTKTHKYTYWWYGNDKMRPTEELFDLVNDPLEMRNLAQSPDYQATLEQMRLYYDRELAAWKLTADENYEIYGTLFDRDVPVSLKANHLTKENKEKT